MKIELLKNVLAPSSAARHENVLRLASLMPIADAHQLESLCWSVCTEKGDKSLGFYLQSLLRMQMSIARKPDLLKRYSLTELLVLDHKSLNMGEQSPFERLTEAKQKVDRALLNLEIDFDMAKFKSVTRCRYCGESKHMTIKHRQTRSSDEGMTEFKRCEACNEEWV